MILHSVPVVVLASISGLVGLFFLIGYTIKNHVTPFTALTAERFIVLGGLLNVHYKAAF
jgi:hypothetical protein